MPRDYMQPLERFARYYASIASLIWMIQNPERVVKMTDLIDQTFRGIVEKRFVIALRKLEEKRAGTS